MPVNSPRISVHSPGRPRLSQSKLCAVMALAMCLAVGCKGFRGKVDNPVVGPRPPRVSGQNPEQTALADTGAATDPSGIVQVSATGAPIIRDEDIAARVNGRPIFVAELLGPYRTNLEQVRQQAPPEQYHQIRREIIEKSLPSHIEQTLVIDAVKSQIKGDQWETIESKLNEYFYDEELPRLLKKQGLATMQELEALMRQQGTNLAEYRRNWGDQQLASQWVSEQIPTITVSRAELVAEYQRRLDEYAEPEQIKWQQCLITSLGAGSKHAAHAKLKQAVAELKEGASFDDVVKRHSDGPKADLGGYWDWTRPESLSDEQLKKTLGELSVNQIGPVLEDERGYRLVKLTGRREARTKPFEEVQDELREALLSQKREAEFKRIMEELRAKAHIETILDDREAT